MSREAMKLALEALEEIKRWTDRWTAPGHPVSIFAGKAITPLQKALANEALDKMAENERELGIQMRTEYERGFIDGMQKQMQSSVDKAVNRMAEQPAQQEPTEWLTGCPSCGMDSCDCDEGTCNPPAKQELDPLAGNARDDWNDWRDDQGVYSTALNPPAQQEPRIDIYRSFEQWKSGNVLEHGVPRTEFYTKADLDLVEMGWRYGYDAGRAVEQVLDKKAENARELGLDYEPQRWAVFCQGCRKEWSVSYPHPGKSICVDCDDKPAQYSDIVSDGGLDPRNKFDKPAQQEPVAYLCENAVGHKYFRWKKPSSIYKPIALYTSPPAQLPWVGLTDEEIVEISIKSQEGISPHDDTLRFARAIEAAHGITGEKNGTR